MLFNSYEFIFAFLPVAVLGFYLFGRLSHKVALGWLVAVSLFFYGWWRPLNILIIAPSILINYGLARWLDRLGRQPQRLALSRLVLGVGIVFNVCFLGYFKYVNFLADV